jgi:two-component system, OmpR family, KDP operon response regulator KdpE
VARLLVVEDDERIRTALIRALRERGHAVSSAGTAMAGLRQAVDERPDLVVLDLGLPDLDGGELLRMLRAVSSVPVVVATARDDDGSVVAALDAGADDYLTKPFGIRELMARVEALMRRSGGTWRAAPPSRELPVVSLMGVTIDPQKHRAECDGEVVSLTPQEFNLLYLLASHPGVVFDREELLARVRDGDVNITNRGVDTLVRRLRIKIEKDPTNPQRIITVWGSGYKFGEV